MIELLTEKDLNEIRRYIQKYAFQYDNNVCRNVDVCHILRFWDKEKQGLLSAGFKDKLILEKEIEFTENICTLVSLLRNKYSEDSRLRRIFLALNEIINNLIIETSKIYKNYGHLCMARDILNNETLIKNKYEDDNIKLYFGDKIIQIKNGCKPIKVLQKINALTHTVSEEDFDYFKTIISQITNTKKSKGIMCLSIHPLDYMTMSDNNYNWLSCMSWKNEGCYRQGTVEMMNSPMVVVGYLKTINGTYMDKKWRELYIVNLEQQFICNIKSYPYNNNIMSRYNVTWLQNIFFPKNNIYEVKDYSYVDETQDMSFTFCPSTDNMYNDFCGNCVTFFSSGITKSEHLEYNFNYSGIAECMACGNTLELSEDCLVCRNCDNRIYCYECGNCVIEDDAICIDGEYYCRYCASNYFTLSAYSGNYFKDEDICRIIVTDDDGLMCIDEDFYICIDEIEDFFKKYAPEINPEDVYDIDHERYVIPTKFFLLDKFDKERSDY